MKIVLFLFCCKHVFFVLENVKNCFSEWKKNNEDINFVENTLFFFYYLNSIFDKSGFMCLLPLVKIQIKNKKVFNEYFSILF